MTALKDKWWAGPFSIVQLCPGNYCWGGGAEQTPEEGEVSWEVSVILGMK